MISDMISIGVYKKKGERRRATAILESCETKMLFDATKRTIKEQSNYKIYTI